MYCAWKLVCFIQFGHEVYYGKFSRCFHNLSDPYIHLELVSIPYSKYMLLLPLIHVLSVIFSKLSHSTRLLPGLSNSFMSTLFIANFAHYDMRKQFVALSVFFFDNYIIKSACSKAFLAAENSRLTVRSRACSSIFFWRFQTSLDSILLGIAINSPVYVINIVNSQLYTYNRLSFHLSIASLINIPKTTCKYVFSVRGKIWPKTLSVDLSIHSSASLHVSNKIRHLVVNTHLVPKDGFFSSIQAVHWHQVLSYHRYICNSVQHHIPHAAGVSKNVLCNVSPHPKHGIDFYNDFSRFLTWGENWGATNSRFRRILYIR